MIKPSLVLPNNTAITPVTLVYTAAGRLIIWAISFQLWYWHCQMMSTTYKVPSAVPRMSQNWSDWHIASANKQPRKSQGNQQLIVEPCRTCHDIRCSSMNNILFYQKYHSSGSLFKQIQKLKRFAYRVQMSELIPVAECLCSLFGGWQPVLMEWGKGRTQPASPEHPFFLLFTLFLQHSQCWTREPAHICEYVLILISHNLLWLLKHLGLGADWSWVLNCQMSVSCDKN